MRHQDLYSLEGILAMVPCDWELRLALIQAYVLREQLGEAKRLVREAPDAAGAPPPHVQIRLHRLLTEGRSAAEEFEQLDGVGRGDALRSFSSLPNLPVEVVASTALSTETDVVELGKDEIVEKPVVSVSAEVAVLASEPTLRAAIIEETYARSKVAIKNLSRGKFLLDKDERAERQQQLDDSGFVLASAQEFYPLQREQDAGQKVSAFSFALLMHVLLVFLLGAIVIAIPLQKPPQIIAVNVAADQILDVPPRRVEKVKTPDRSAAAAQATMVISSTAVAPVTVPDFEQTASSDVATYLTDMKAGLGMSLEGETEESDVNFFGIQSGGRKIVFIIDASPSMLVDEKGGMFAYDRVKEELGQMLVALNRGTSFNIILYDAKRLKMYQSELVPARPSKVRLAIAWLDPLNRNYEKLGLARVVANVAVSSGHEPIASGDIAGYAKAMQVALEMKANTIFCIAGGYLRINRARAPMREMGTPGKVDPKQQAAWNKAARLTRKWLNKENVARKSKGQAPKVVTNFGALVRQVTGASPPRARGGSGGAIGKPPYSPEEIEDQIKNLVKELYREQGKAVPQLNLVLFLGKGEDIGEYKDHFRRLTRRNKGKLKILEGLAALKDVTAAG